MFLALIQKRCGGPYRGYRNTEIKYKGIEKYLNEHELSTRRFADFVDMNYVALYYILTGKHEPSKKSIDRILKATGLTYEEAFGGIEND